MKKTVYVVCVCVLFVLLFYEVKRNYETENDGTIIVPTGSFVSKVQKENQKTAYLTFDDGPSGNTKKIIKILEEKGAVATFFLIGKEITGERVDTVKELKKKGNAIGVHTYCHEHNQMYASANCFYKDFRAASDCIEKIIGEKPTLHRFPWGSNNGYVKSYVDELHNHLRKEGVRSFDWNVSGEDSISPHVSQAVIFQNVKKMSRALKSRLSCCMMPPPWIIQQKFFHRLLIISKNRGIVLIRLTTERNICFRRAGADL